LILINNDNCFIIDDKDLDDFDALKLKFSILGHVDEHNDNYKPLISFLAGIKIKYDEIMCLNPDGTIDKQLKQKTSSEVLKMPSLVNEKVIINGPAGTGKTYRLMDNIINLLTPTQRIGLVYSDDVDETTQDELNKEKVKIFKYLKEFNLNILGSIKCYLFEENILIIIACDKINFILIEEFNLDFLATIGRSCEYEFIVEQKYY
jgi:hypothetical protein